MRNTSPLSTQVIAKTIRLHALWLADPSTGARANLAGANLAGADLTGADLTRANFTGADLRRADLADAYLEGANLAGADLADANLARAYLARANLAGANLTGAYLAGADLRRADLAGADLTSTDLTGANLVDANLAYADLGGGAGEMHAMREVDQGPSLDSETGIGSAARRRVQESLIDEYISHTESITIHMSGIDDEWTLVVTTGKAPPYGYVAAGRILIAIDTALDSEPLAGLLWIKEYGKKMITHVWVDPEVQGQGIGRTLVDVYKKHVSRSVTLAGPFSDAGLAFAKRTGGKIVSERSRPKTTR
jgi:GNAT superfamily N-acetyltransferase